VEYGEYWEILNILEIPKIPEYWEYWEFLKNTYFIISKVIAEKARIWRMLGNSEYSGNSKDSGILGIIGEFPYFLSSSMQKCKPRSPLPITTTSSNLIPT